MSDSRTQTTLEHSLQKPLQTSFCYPDKNEGFLEGRLSESRSAVQLAVLVCKQVSEMQYMTKKDQNLDERDDRKRPESGMLNMLNLFRLRTLAGASLGAALSMLLGLLALWNKACCSRHSSWHLTCCTCGLFGSLTITIWLSLATYAFYLMSFFFVK